MAEIIPAESSKLEKIKRRGKIVLVGGCFDILHPGHLSFLEKAKATGDILVVLLESDQKVSELKGPDRPIHSQAQRAEALLVLPLVDYIVTLPYFNQERQYDELVAKIGPAIIAGSSKDENIHHQRAAKLSGAQFRVVTGKIGGYSSSQMDV